MTPEESITALHRLSVETGSLTCLGCGYEHNCSTRGCAILRDAADKIAQLNDFRAFDKSCGFEVK